MNLFGTGTDGVLAYFQKYPIMNALASFLSLGKQKDVYYHKVVTKDPLKL